MEIRNLVIAGGCVHGFGYVGAVAALEHLQILKSIKKVAGISPGGALTALFLALGFPVDELVSNLVKHDLEHMLDTEPVPVTSKGGGAGCCGGPGTPEPPPDAFILNSELTHTLHIHSGARLHKWLSSLIEKSTLRPNCTFAELHEFVTGKRNVSLLRRGAIFRDLVLVGYNLASNYCFVFSYESTPDAIIADAVRIAVAAPYLFTPWAYYEKESARAERRVAPGYEGIFWVDGGIVQPYPVTIFDSDTSPKGSTLGLCLTNQQELIQYKDDAEEAATTTTTPSSSKQMIRSIWDYSVALVQSGFYRHVLDDADATNRTVFISNCGLNPMAIGGGGGVSNRDKNRLMESGWNSVMAKLYRGGMGMGNEEGHGEIKTEFPKCAIRLKE